MLLGEYGTGKTTYLRYLFFQLASQKLDIKSDIKVKDPKYRTVVYLPLHKFSGDFESFVITHLAQEGIEDKVLVNLIELNKDGGIIILLDAFDEMIKTIEEDQKKRCFKYIEKLISQGENTKVILTSRSELFQSDDEIEKIFRFREKSNYAYLYIDLFDNEQIQKFLKRRVKNAEDFRKKMDKIPELKDLSQRAVLLQFIIKYLEKIKNKKHTNASDLYDAAFEDELDRKKTALVNELPDKFRMKILKDLAIWMFLNARREIGIDTMKEELKLREYFKVNHEWQFEKYLNEFLTFTFLLRVTDYTYKISHQSFTDYLTAQAMVEEINSGQVEHFGKKRFSDEIDKFILEQDPDTEKLFELLNNSKDLGKDKRWQGTNALLTLFKIDKDILEGRIIKNAHLEEVKFSYNGFSGTTIESSNLFKCEFNNYFLTANIADSDFTKSVLELFHHNYPEVPDFSLLKNLISIQSLGLSGSKGFDISPLKNLTKVTMLSLKHTKVFDISPLKNLTNLAHLDLRSTMVFDISPLKNLTNLQWLSLAFTHVSDVSPLENLTNLTDLYLELTPVADISPLRNLVNLIRLIGGSNSITDILSLKNLTKLQILCLDYTHVSDILPLKNLKNLTELGLKNTQVSDISPLKNLTNLISLELSGIPISDISPIKNLTKLTVLKLDREQKYRFWKDLQNLKKILPGLKIISPEESSGLGC